MLRTATFLAMAASISLSAQTPPAQTPSVSVTGCIAQVQRDGSLGPKASGVQATPQTAADEANNPNPTNRYELLDATPVGNDVKPGETATAGTTVKPARTAYALRGHENELAKHVGHRVQITGALTPPLAEKLPAKDAKAAETVRSVQVASLKMVGTDCSPKAK
jgi:hypothetical protein